MILYDGWTFYKENDEGKMISAAQGETGDSVKIWKENGQIVEKTAIRLLKSGDEKEFNFINVCADDNDYWVIDSFIAEINSVPALVKGEGRSGSEPKDTRIGKQKLEAGSMTAVTGNKQDGFAEIIVYDGNKFGKKVFVKEDMVDTNSSSIEVMKTRKKLESTENLKESVRNEVESMLMDLENR